MSDVVTYFQPISFTSLSDPKLTKNFYNMVSMNEGTVLFILFYFILFYLITLFFDLFIKTNQN